MKQHRLLVIFLIVVVGMTSCSKEDGQVHPEADAPAVTGQVQEKAGKITPSKSPQEGLQTESPRQIDGKTVYEKTCVVCHGEGIAGAPKVGDQEAWKARMAQGVEAMVAKAITGYQGSQGSMPARGGNASLSDDEVRAAVVYMTEKSQ